MIEEERFMERTVSEEERRQIQQKALKILLEVDRICKKEGITYSLAYGTMLGAVRHKGFIPWDDDVDLFMMRADYERFRQACRSELGEEFFYQSRETDREYYYSFNKIRLNGTVFEERSQTGRKMHSGLFVDIFPIDYVYEDDQKRKKQLDGWERCWKALNLKKIRLAAVKGVKKLIFALLRLPLLCVPDDYLYRKAESYRREAGESELCFIAGMARDDKYVMASKHFASTVDMDFEGHRLPCYADYDVILTACYGDYMQPPAEKDRPSTHVVTRLEL